MILVEARLITAPPQESRVIQACPVRLENRDERIRRRGADFRACDDRLHTVQRRKIQRTALPNHVDLAIRVEGDAKSGILVAAAKEGREHPVVASGVDFGQKTVSKAGQRVSAALIEAGLVSID